jgi:NADH-quinone oxidoreductase subunit J
LRWRFEDEKAMTTVLFYIFAAVAVASAALVVIFRNPVYSALSLVTTFFCIAGLFVLLDAYFLSAVMVIVYAGAIMILFLFVIMLLNRATRR